MGVVFKETQSFHKSLLSTYYVPLETWGPLGGSKFPDLKDLPSERIGNVHK